MNIFSKHIPHAKAMRLSVALLLAPVTGIAEQEAPLDLLDLEQLLQMEVTTASRKAQTLSRTPAAAYVISHEDIRRAGVTSLPEALRLAPGVQVAQINPRQWSVTIRGFGGRYASKLLVLIDGRSIYGPAFSGVYWETHSPLLDDIERIEVIRGPGATLWGANAVNGVINIITRHSSDSQGGAVHLLAGDQEQSLGVRYGAKSGDGDSYHRVYAKLERQAGFDDLDGVDLDNGFERYRLGTRRDWYANDNKDQFSVHAEAMQMQQSQTVNQPDMSRPSLSRIVHLDNDSNAAYALGRWIRSLAVDSEFSLQGYAEYQDRHTFEYDEARFTANLDFQYRMALGSRHDFLWGATYRYSRDTLSSPLGILREPHRALNIFSVFAQDEFEMVPERLWLTAGIKAEDSEYSDLAWQPNLRLLWTPSARHSLWASVARAVRMPSRAERDLERFDVLAQWLELPTIPTPVPALLSLTASTEFESEQVVAYEAGYRSQFNKALSVDLALFYNDYRKLRDLAPQQPVLQAAGYLLVPVAMINAVEGGVYGAEVTFDWRPSNDLRWQLAYTWIDFALSGDLPPAQSQRTFYERGDPHQLVSLRGGWQINTAWTTDFWLRWTGEAPLSGGLRSGHAGGVESYTALDLRLAWSPWKNLEVALIGKNLLETSHQETIDDFFAIPNQVPRSVALSLRWRF